MAKFISGTQPTTGQSNDALIIEQATNYAFTLQKQKVSFATIRETSSVFYRMLPDEIQTQLFEDISRGVCPLDSEPCLNTYMFALGKMHNAKLRRAYDHLSAEFRQNSLVDIVDYGCGQGMGCICYADFLRENGLRQRVRRVILIEPSRLALARAALHVSLLFPDAELKTVCKGFDDLTVNDLPSDPEVATLHILSNVLDLGDRFFRLNDFSDLVAQSLKGRNEFVCVEPLFNGYNKDDKPYDFFERVNIKIYFDVQYGKNEFVPGEQWTCAILLGVVNNDKIVTRNKRKRIVGISTRNMRSLESLMVLMGDGINILPAEKEGEYRFTCGELQGHVAEPAAVKMLQENDLDPAHYQFIEVKDESGKWIPSIRLGYTEAVKWYRKAAEQGDADAQYQLGKCYDYGRGVTQDFTEAVKWYRKAAEQGDADAQYQLGKCYDYGRGVTQDFTEAVKWYRKAAEQGHAVAQHNLGYCYDEGEGVPQDYTEAVKWYRKAAEQGNAAAQCNLGYCYDEGQGVTQDYTEAVKWYRKAAEQGNAAAQNNLGFCYVYGRGVTQDYTEAVKWYRKAAEQGHAVAQHNLGFCYEKGLGVTQDYTEAVKWYRKATEQGNAAAQNNLGYCYDEGQGVTQDYTEAVKWYRKAAEQGNAAAQYDLGFCYEKGLGVPQDYMEAVKWYRKAAEQGHTAAQRRKRDITVTIIQSRHPKK